MSGNRWDKSAVPQKGWSCVDVVDLRPDVEFAEESAYATCQMCGNERIRFVHVMEHPEMDRNFEVGCVCAEKMSDDYEEPKRREAKLRNRAARRARWLQRKWRVSASGNDFLNLEGYNLVVYSTKAGRWGYKIGDRFGPRTYPAKQEAKLALFDDFWMATQDHEQLWSAD